MAETGKNNMVVDLSKKKRIDAILIENSGEDIPINSTEIDENQQVKPVLNVKKLLIEDFKFKDNLYLHDYIIKNGEIRLYFGNLTETTENLDEISYPLEIIQHSNINEKYYEAQNLLYILEVSI